MGAFIKEIRGIRREQVDARGHKSFLKSSQIEFSLCYDLEADSQMLSAVLRAGGQPATDSYLFGQAWIFGQIDDRIQTSDTSQASMV